MFFGRALRDLGVACYGLPSPVARPVARPEYATTRGHPERVIPLAQLPEDECRWWKALEKDVRRREELDPRRRGTR
jgi:hypothetical protein